MKNKKILKIFLLISILLFAIFIFLLMGDNKDKYLGVFFAKFQDFMADFLNVCAYIVKKNPYNNQMNGYAEKAYLPISYLLLYPFAKIGNFENVNSLQESLSRPVNLFMAFIFSLVSIIIFIVSINKLAKKWGVNKKYLIPIYISGIFLFAIERGNFVILSVSLLLLFLTYYDNENKWLRLAAAFCLALTASLKLYPVVFGLLYLKNKQFKDAFISAIFAILLVFLPFLFFKGGFSNISLLFRNLKLNSERYSGVSMFSGLSVKNFTNFISLGVLGKSAEYTSKISQNVFTIFRIATVICVLISIFSKNRFNIIASLFFATIFLQENSRFYCILYIIPVYMYMIKQINDTNETKSIIKYIPLLTYFILIFNPIIIEMKIGKFRGYINEYLITLITIIFFIVVFIKVVVEGVKQINYGKKSSKQGKEYNNCTFSI